jgi:AcrR family transcriptional regulator
MSEFGFAGLTVDAVVARAQASKATVYRRWATKEELAIAAFDLLPLLEIESCGNLVDDIVCYAQEYALFMETTPLRSVLPALVGEATHNPVLAEKLRQTVSRRRESGIMLVKAAIERGELPASTDPVLAQELFIGPIVNRTFFYPDNFELADFHKIATIIVAGLKSAPA